MNVLFEKLHFVKEDELAVANWFIIAGVTGLITTLAFGTSIYNLTVCCVSTTFVVLLYRYR
jgi:hypothetical protein